MRESDVVARVARAFGDLVAPGALALADDAAALPPTPLGATRVVTTDMVVEGRDFKLTWGGAESAGHRAILQNLSDLSAMGARAVGFVWSLALPRAWIDDDLHLDRFVAGAAALARREHLHLFGGDLSSTDGPFVAAITAFGDVDGAPLVRSAARAGDGLFVAGPLGASRRGLSMLEAGLTDAAAVRAHLWHDGVDLTLGRRLVGRARGVLDLSDGLAADLPRLCRASRVGAKVDALDDARATTSVGQVSLEDALLGGEDYHLLFTLAPDDDGRDLERAVRIGTITADAGIVVESEGRTIALDDDTRPLAFDHFDR
jgi:thiamine-monophosphate kinase